MQLQTQEKPIVKLTGVTFTYPTATTPQLTDVNIAARLSSRVAVIGVNGAGKSVRSFPSTHPCYQLHECVAA